MKKSIIKIIAISLLISFYNCKEKPSKENKNDDKVVVNKNDNKEESIFKIVLGLSIPNDDVLEVYYTDYDNDKYSYKTKIKKKVLGEEVSQKVEFILPKEVFPTSLRFDLGTNKSEENLKINSITMSYEDFNFSISPQEFHAFFAPNKFVKYNKETGVVERKIVEGKYDPYFNARAVFRKKLEIEIR